MDAAPHRAANLRRKDFMTRGGFLSVYHMLNLALDNSWWFGSILLGCSLSCFPGNQQILLKILIRIFEISSEFSSRRDVCSFGL